MDEVAEDRTTIQLDQHTFHHMTQHQHRAYSLEQSRRKYSRLRRIHRNHTVDKEVDIDVVDTILLLCLDERASHIEHRSRRVKSLSFVRTKIHSVSNAQLSSSVIARGYFRT
jgi:hypothetical protein